MSTTKVAISIEKDLLAQIDELVEKQLFPNRSKVIREAIAEKLQRIKKTRLAIECAKLNPQFERALAEEGLSREIDEWPEY